jgi:4-amino-4-deoxy-L-arabinose transferase-like glycosyltransferase
VNAPGAVELGNKEYLRQIHWIALAGALVSLLFAWMVPFGANPDETAHRDHVALLAKSGGALVVFVPPPGRKPLPEPVLERIEKATGMRELPEGASSRDEAHQPPGYYVMAARVWHWTGGNVAWVRGLSAVFQFATVTVIGLGMLGSFPGRPSAAIGAAALAAVWPVQAQLGGAVSNDALCHFWCALVVVVAARWVQHGAGIKDSVILGVVLGAGMLTKSTVLQLVPLVGLALGLAVARRKMAVPAAAGRFAIVLGIAFAMAAPWFWRNVTLYGDPLARSIYVATGPNFEPEAIRQMAGWSSLEYYGQVGIRTFASLWYFLDPNLPFSAFIGPIGPLTVVVLLCVAGVVGTLRLLRGASGLSGNEKATLILLMAAPWLLVPFYAVFVSTVFQAQGRYFLPAIVGVAATLVLGCSELFARRPRLGAMVPAIVLGLLCLIQWTGAGFVPSGPAKPVATTGG